jgi:hypothetical protein
MPPPSVLAALKEVQHERGDRSPFKDHTHFLRWVDQAEPLLGFNQALLEEFQSTVRAATLMIGWKQDKYDGAVNSVIGAVNRAIIELEHQEPVPAPTPSAPQTEHSAPAAPERLTLKWLYEHAPWSFYAWFFGSLAAAFAAGLSASEALTTMKSMNLSNQAPTTTRPMSASEPSKSASHP